MTVRSVILGLLGAATICGVTFLNDRILRGTYLIGNNMPISVYGLLLIFVVFVNPYLKRLALTGREIAVALALTLAACTIPSSGLLRTFPGVLILPKHYEKAEPGWKGGPGAIREGDVRDWTRLVADLRGAKSPAFSRAPAKPGASSPAFSRAPAKPGASSPARGEVRSRLPEELRQALGDAPESQPPGDELRAEVVKALNDILRDRSFARERGFDDLDLPEHVRWLRSRDPGSLAESDVRVLNRGIVDALFADAIRPRLPGIVEEVPKKMLADLSRDEDKVLGGFIQGMGEVGGHVSPGDVPWRAWVRTLLFWVPIILALWGALVGLSLVVHRQWSRHERLPYPIATFTNALLPDEGSHRSSILANRLFWLGAVPVFLIHLNNYGCRWFPEQLIGIPTRFNFSPLGWWLFPTIMKGGGGWTFNWSIYFTVIGIAFFIPTDISLGFGLGPFLWWYVVGLLAGYGVSLNATVEGTDWWMGLKPRSFIIFGAVLGVFLSLVYTGRNHYASVLRRALGMKGGDEAEPSEVWGLRAFLGLTALFVAMVAVGARTGFFLAFVYAAIVIVGFVVTSRIIAETGLFHIQIAVFPCVIMWGLFGARAIGVRTLLAFQILSMVLLIDPRESLMPFMVNSLKLLELRRQSPGRPGAFAALALVVGLAVGLPLTLYLQYDHGRTSDSWAEETVPKMPFNNLVSVRQKLAGQGVLEESTRARGLARAASVFPNATCVWAMTAGLALVLVFTVARLRFPWWPLHPLMFALWATNHVNHFAASFLLGWAAKGAVTKYGGSLLYHRLKPLMIGLIAGEVFGAVVPCIVGAFYYAATGRPPEAFLVLPG